MNLPVPLSFDWDKVNIDKNWKRHKVFYREAEEAFLNNKLRTFPDPKHSSKKEKRYVAFGETEKARKLTIIFTLRNNKIRIVSARDQSRKERKAYVKK